MGVENPLLEQKLRDMPDLIHSLKDRDLGHLRIVAENWGLELVAPDARSALASLTAAMLDTQLFAEVFQALPDEAKAALGDLVGRGGRLSWPLFTRRYGRIQEMGSGRRDRERPDQSPISPAEQLWYYALIARAFFDTPNGPQELAYIPADLLVLVEELVNAEKIPQTGAGPTFARAAATDERAREIPATDHILDRATTVLAARRIEMPDEELSAMFPDWQPANPFLRSLLFSAGLLARDGTPKPEPTRAFLERPRSQALALLVETWLNSTAINELRQLEHLRFEGEWENDPLRARRAILDFLARLHGDSWWSLSSFLAAVRQHQPDFQRPAGDYDSWFIRDRRTNAYLRGFEHWDQVDGELIRYMLTGPMHWLGILDLAGPGGDAAATSFRLSAWSGHLLKAAAPPGFPDEQDKFHVRSDGRISAPRLAPLSARYQIARFCTWEGARGGVPGHPPSFRYRLNPGSLVRARDQGLQVGHLAALLRKHAETVPPTLIAALERWETHGVEARLEAVTVLRLSSPDLLEKVRRSRAARFLGDPLGPTSIVIKEGAAEKVLGVLAELGYLGEVAL